MLCDVQDEVRDAVYDVAFQKIRMRDELVSIWSRLPEAKWSAVRTALYLRPSLFGLDDRDVERIVLGVDTELGGRAGDDALLLAGFEGNVPSPLWGDTMVQRLKEAQPVWTNEDMALHWIDRYAGGIDADPQLDRILDCVGISSGRDA